MYSYRINNSYTVYVNWAYYNEVKKITKESRKKQACVPVRSSVKKTDVIIPLPIGAKVSSKAYGLGVLQSKRSDGVISVKFDERLISFVYPDAFRAGHLAEVN